jgi:hypothetical protein
MSILVSKQSLQIANGNLSNFDENSVISTRFEILRRLNALSIPFYTPKLFHVDFSVETIPSIAKRNFSNFDENSVNSIRFEILRRLNALSTPFYTPNVVHVDFCVETIAANRKTQSFKFRRKPCYFVPDWDITSFKRSLHSILHAECSACRFQCRNNPCKSQNVIFQISTKTLLFRSGLRFYGV